MGVVEVLSPAKREQILTGAARIFAQDGYEGASMSRIAAEADVSKGTLYNHFESKAALFAAYVEQECGRNLAHVFASTTEKGSPAEVLAIIAERMLLVLLSPTGLTTYRVVVSEAAKFPQLARRFFEAGPARAIREMALWLEHETESGRLRVPDPEFAAEQFFALCQTSLALRRRLMIHADPSPSEIRRVVDASVAMFVNTYGAENRPSSGGE